MIGATISHYEVIEKIGQGGMGEVYRTEDQKGNSYSSRGYGDDYFRRTIECGPETDGTFQS